MNKTCRIFLKPVSVLMFMGLGFISNGQEHDYEATIFGLGASFGGGLGAPGISYDLLPGYSGTISPGAMLSYEHRFDKHFGIGAFASFSNASLSSTIVYPSEDLFTPGTLLDKISANYIGIGAKPLFHFGSNDRFDPYIGPTIGILLISMSSTITTTQGSYGVHDLFSDLMLGVAAGARVYVSDKFGFWLELSYSGFPNYLASAGIAYKIPAGF